MTVRVFLFFCIKILCLENGGVHYPLALYNPGPLSSGGDMSPNTPHPPGKVRRQERFRRQRNGLWRQ